MTPPAATRRPSWRDAAGGRRQPALIVVALAAGLVLAWIDAGPRFDDTGVLVALIVAASLVIAALSGRRPWLWALLVGAPVPVVEIASGGSLASLAALALAAIGAAIGSAVSAALRPRTI